MQPLPARRLACFLPLLLPISWLLLLLPGGCSKSELPPRAETGRAAVAGPSVESAGEPAAPADGVKPSGEPGHEPSGDVGEVPARAEPAVSPDAAPTPPGGQTADAAGAEESSLPAETAAARAEAKPSIDAILAAAEAESQLFTAVALGLIEKGSPLEQSLLKMIEDARAGKFPADAALFASSGFGEGKIGAATRAAIESYGRAATDEQRAAVASQVQGGQCHYLLTLAQTLGVVKKDSALDKALTQIVADVRDGKLAADVGLFAVGGFGEGQIDAATRAAIESYSGTLTDAERQAIARRIQAGHCASFLSVAVALEVVKEQSPVYQGSQRLLADVENGSFPAGMAIAVMRRFRESGSAAIGSALEAYGRAKADQEKQDATRRLCAIAQGPALAADGGAASADSSLPMEITWRQAERLAAGPINPLLLPEIAYRWKSNKSDHPQVAILIETRDGAFLYRVAESAPLAAGVFEQPWQAAFIFAGAIKELPEGSHPIRIAVFTPSDDKPVSSLQRPAADRLSNWLELIVIKNEQGVTVGPPDKDDKPGTGEVSANAPFRIWTSRDGRTIEASLVAVQEKQVTIRRKSDGKTYVMPLQNLSDADQAWVQKQALPSADSRAASANQPGVADNRPASERITWVDRFEDAANLLGGKGGPYAKQPSKIEASRVDGASLGRNGKVLKLDFEKQGQGGPYGNGGWCGYAISLGPGGKPFDASKHLKLVFWLRGQTGGENFKLGLADVQWARQGDSIKSEDIVHYVAGGKISTQWQKVQVPLEIFYLDHKTLASVSIAFETDCFPDGAGRGVVYVDDLGFE